MELGPGTGINGGVMLLPPNNRLHEQALTEVGQDYHPAIIPSAGPEQDYLSRFCPVLDEHIREL